MTMQNKNENLWKAKYLLHIDEIDKQHQHYFSICSKLASLCEVARSGKAVSIGQLLISIFELRSYAFKHFIAEESLLVKYNYPKSFSHIEQHDLYLEKIREFTKKVKNYHKKSAELADKGLLNEAEDLSEFALDWWSRHIMEKDSHYADFIKKVGREKAR